MGKTNSLITASQIVSRYRLSYQTLNYYTALRLLSVARREKHRRLYRERQVRENLQRIKRLKDQGYPLGLIRRLVNSRSPRSF